MPRSDDLPTPDEALSLWAITASALITATPAARNRVMSPSVLRIFILHH